MYNIKLSKKGHKTLNYKSKDTKCEKGRKENKFKILGSLWNITGTWENLDCVIIVAKTRELV